MPTIITLPVEISPEVVQAAVQGRVRQWVGPEIAEDVVRAVLGDVLGDERPRSRSHWARVLADEIRACRAQGREWQPDYDDLMARTGWRRSWCEKTVRAARELVEAGAGPHCSRCASAYA